MITEVNIFDIAPEFTTTNQDQIDRINRFILRAAGYISFAVFMNQYDEALSYLTAHMLTVSKRKGIAGMVTGERVGSISRNYGHATRDPIDEFDSTSYGVHYKLLRDSIVKTPIIG